jgi:hypothetical protein
MTILYIGPPLPPKNPNTKMKIKGKKILNKMADGLRNMALKLAFVMASIPRS